MNRIRLILIIIISMMAPVQAQTYQRLWEDVKQMEEKGLPRSAIEKATLIYDKAQAEKNVPQMMRAYLTMMAFRGEIAPDSIEVDMKALEEWAADKGTTVTDKAVLYSILGGMTISKDFEKGNEYLLLSLKDSAMLAQYPADKLVPMVKNGETSRLYFDNNLYDLLARRAIELWAGNSWGNNRESVLERISDTYQSLLNLYKREGKRSAWLLTALDTYPSVKEEQLRGWVKEYGDLEVCAEVYLRLSKRMSGENCLAWVREGISRYPHYHRINALKNVEKKILTPYLSMDVSSAYPDKPIEVEVNYNNLLGLVSNVYRLDLAPDSKELESVNEKTVKEYGTWFSKELVELPPTTDYREATMKIALRPLPQGVYYLLVNGKNYPDVKNGTVIVVDADMEIYRPLPDNQRETFILDKRNGTPKGDAIVSKETDRWQRYRYTENKRKQTHVNLFTDRAIYRPGQTVNYSGLVYEQQGDSVGTVEGKEVRIDLQDTNGKTIKFHILKTDEFGTFSSSFLLPDDGQTGNYCLKTEGCIQTIRVEEYKRPTFEVVFSEVKETYKAGDSLEVAGKAKTFAGAPVQNATVKYTVEQMERIWWRNRGPVTNRVEGETQTDADGNFVVPVHFLPMEEERWMAYTYVVKADVTSGAGETQSGSMDLPLGTSSLMVEVTWAQTFVKEKPEAITFAVCNLMRQPIETEVICEVMQEDKLLSRFVVKSNESLIPQELYTLPSGQYILKVSVEDEDGKWNKQKCPFTIFSLEDTRLPYETVEWDYQTSNTFPATILYGSSEKDVTLFYDVFSGNKHLESQRIVFSDSLLRFPFEYKEEYGDGVLVSLAFVKNNQLHWQSYDIRKPRPDKSLQLKWITFRDKLQPGDHETWTLRVCHPDGKVARANLLAAMYDASLDTFISHFWDLNVAFNRSIPYSFWRAEGNENRWLGLHFPSGISDVHPLTYSRLDVPVITPKRLILQAKSLGVKNDVTESLTEESYEEEAIFQCVEPMDMKKETPVRSNFAENAFFYTYLRTDKNGEVSFSFTLPESLTTWKFMGLAHTQDMDYGQITAKVVASKEFMLQPNMPRFVRVGDEVSLSASLVNLSDKDVIGNVRMELFNPKNDKVYLTKKQRFIVTPNATTTVHFGFEVSEKYEDLAVRWMAEGDNFSDGEQRVLPVLGNKQWMTESVPLYINGEGTSTFSLETLFNHHSKSITHPKMTVEFTGNSAWYAVEALPMLAEPQNEDALSWATAYYANTLTRHLTSNHPNISHQFDEDILASRISNSVRKLVELQNADGAWSWYKGMDGSRFITTQIVELLARLQTMTGKVTTDEEVKNVYARALAYLAKKAKEEHEEMKKWEKEGNKHLFPSEQALHYLYICALDDNQSADKKVNDYFIDKLVQLDGKGQLTIYGKACSAIILQQADKKQKAKEFLQSVMEYTVYTDEMGRYFDTPRAEYSWRSYKIPTQVAVMEAVHRVANEEKTMEEMKRWLLQQKRVQDWETPIATTDAVYALLNMDESVWTNTGKCRIDLGKTTLYVKESDTLTTVKQRIEDDIMNIRQVTVEKFSPGMGWGAVYAEYQEDMDKIGAQGNALSVSKEIYKDGKPLADKEPLKVGDKLTVRLTVRADRDMDFIEVKDERAACLEPVDVLSGYRWTDGNGYFQRTKDSSTSFFMDRMRKGMYVLQYDVYVNLAGSYQGGAATIQSVYAPEFGGHDGGNVLYVE